MKACMYIDDNRDDGPLLDNGHTRQFVADINNVALQRLLDEFPPESQVDRSLISLYEMVGSGQFGVVYRAEIEGEFGKIKQVAIKTVKNEMNAEDNDKVILKSYRKHINHSSIL